MNIIKFECHARRPDGERLYRLIIDDKVVREGLTIDDVVEAINDRDEARLGMDHAPRTPREKRIATAACALPRNDREDGGGRGGHDSV